MGQTVDRQALFVVDAIRDIATQLERRNSLRADDAAAAKARSLALDDVDRLANLVSLATTLPLHELDPAIRNVLDETLDRLRRRVSHLGTALAMDKIRAIRAAAEQSVHGDGHALGKSFILRSQFVRYLGYLIGLAEGLSAEDEDDVRTAAAAVNAAIAIDHGGVESLVGDADLPAIDMDSLTFPNLAGEAA